ncbi:MAG: hypothetical protein FWC41_07275 [Firmicutes bacterium]|nr:hypothetical protein [Bacillota bacterium]
MNRELQVEQLVEEYRKTLKDYKFTDFEMENAFISGLNKQFELLNTPKKPIIEDWQVSTCPNCDEGFYDYEPCNDGYYKRAYSLERCPYCGQKLKWH